MGRTKTGLLRTLRQTMGTSLFALTFMGGAALWALWVQGGSLAKLTLETLPTLRALSDLRGAADEIEASLAREPDLEAARRGLRDLEGAAGRLPQGLWSPLEGHLESLRRGAAALGTAGQTPTGQASPQTLEALRAATAAIEAEVAAEVAKVFEVSGAADALAEANRFRGYVIAGLVLGWVTVVAAFVLLWRRLESPLQGLLDYLAVTAERNLQASLEVCADDEMGTLARAVNGVTATLVNALRSLRRVAAEMSTRGSALQVGAQDAREGAAGQLARVEAGIGKAREVEDVLRPLLTLAGGLREGSEEAAASVQEILAMTESVRAEMEGLLRRVVSSRESVEDLSNTVSRVAAVTTQVGAAAQSVAAAAVAIDRAAVDLSRGAGEGLVLAEDVVARAAEGRQSMTDALGGMDRIRVAVGAAVESFDRLEGGLSRVGRVTQVIDDIAARTNLLSLNAAIIAAQAGERGKAFGVVATEIRALAEKTGASTREIRAIVEDVVSQGRVASQAIGAGAERVDQGVRLVRETHEALEEIHGGADRAAGRLREIEQGAVQQASEAARVAEEIGQVSQGVTSIVADVQEQEARTRHLLEDLSEIEVIANQTTVASDEQAKGTESITQAVVEVSQASERVRAAIAQVGDLLVGLREDLEVLGERAGKELGRVSRLEDHGAEMASLAGALRQEVDSFRLPEESPA
jgi:methyl-accepting chemotaxis protein